jgi:hypothetical protein
MKYICPENNKEFENVCMDIQCSMNDCGNCIDSRLKKVK